MFLNSGSVEDGGKPGAARQWDPQPRQRLGAGLSRDAVLQQLLLPEFLWIQHKPQHYLLVGFLALKPQDFQPIWGAVCWDEFPTVPVSLPSRWSQGMWGQDRQIFLTLMAQLSAACTIPKGGNTKSFV